MMAGATTPAVDSRAETELEPEVLAVESKSSTISLPDDPDTTLSALDFDSRRYQISEACARPSHSTGQISELSRLSREPAGFLNDELRRIAWPVLLLCEDHSTIASNDRARGATEDSQRTQAGPWHKLPEHRDEGQVRLDVDRSFVYYPVGLSSDCSRSLKEDLFEVIVATLRRHPTLCYFQGFHDIVQVLLLVLGKEEAINAVASVSLLRLRDFMLPSLSTSLTHLELLPALLSVADPALAQHIAGTRPFFALGATLTLFAHEVESYTEIARLFDFLLAHEAAAAVYLFACIILSRKKELLAIPADEPEMLHFTLSKMPKPLDIDALVSSSYDLMHRHPPEDLPGRIWSQISKYSVLKTTRPGRTLTIDEAADLFNAQLSEMKAAEQWKRTKAIMWQWRRPVGGLGIAVAVALLSILLQKNSMMASPG